MDANDPKSPQVPPPATQDSASVAAPDATPVQVGSRQDSEIRLQQEVARAIRYQHPLGIALVELDLLAASPSPLTERDRPHLLSRFIRHVRSVQRDCDVLQRWSETVFLWLLPETDLDAGVLACERLRRSTAGLVLGGMPPITLSIGVAELESGEDASSLMRRVSYALLASQARGRNCVTRADVLPKPDTSR